MTLALFLTAQLDVTTIYVDVVLRRLVSTSDIRSVLMPAYERAPFGPTPLMVRSMLGCFVYFDRSVSLQFSVLRG